ncbi:MAG: cytochrome P460 family protein [Betaproteobacteria bacterium]|nr:cytochrome P460 family protein [Betaproteobacteria bacterium]
MFARRLTTLCLVSFTALTGSAAFAGADKVAFPENWDKGVLYGTVDRHDIKQYRELYSTKAAVDAVKAGKPIPSGTVLTLVQYKAKVDDKGNVVKGTDGKFQKGDLVAYTVMEKRAGWGTEYKDDIRNGEWEYQVFTADKKPNEKANINGCFQCHKPHEKQDFVISLAKLSGTAPGAKPVPKSGTVVAVADFLFGPEKAEAKVGQPVTWANMDDSPHQVTLSGPNGRRSGVMLKGQTETMTFDAPGVYSYICGLHPNMKGTVEVK